MSERTFLDTNVLLYAEDASAGTKRTEAQRQIDALLKAGSAVVSTQVLQEFFVRATAKLGISVKGARDRVETYSRLDVVLLQPDLILSAIDLHRLHSVSFWDAMIVRAAQLSGCSRVLTEDLQHGRKFDGVVIENPFVAIAAVP